MKKLLFQEHVVEELINTIHRNIRELKEANHNHPENIRAREEALQIISSYSHKDAQGRPVQEPISENEKNRLIDVELTPVDVDLLGLDTTTISLLDLQKMCRAEATFWKREYRQKKKHAAHIIANAEKKYERYNSAVTDINIRYAHAVEAFSPT